VPEREEEAEAAEDCKRGRTRVERRGRNRVFPVALFAFALAAFSLCMEICAEQKSVQVWVCKFRYTH